MSASRGIWSKAVWGKKQHIFWDDLDHGQWSRCGHAQIDTKRLVEARERRGSGLKVPVEEKCKLCQRPQTKVISFRPSP